MRANPLFICHEVLRYAQGLGGPLLNVRSLRVWFAGEHWVEWCDAERKTGIHLEAAALGYTYRDVCLAVNEAFIRKLRLR